MEPRLYRVVAPELKGQVVITRRPRGFEFLDDDVASWRAQGVNVVVSMLERHEAAALGLDQQGAICARHGIEFVSVPVADFAVPPSIEAVRTIVDGLVAHLEAGRSVALHCFASRGRSPTLAAAVLVQQGLSADDAVARLAFARGLHVPETRQQRQWIDDYARALER